MRRHPFLALTGGGYLQKTFSGPEGYGRFLDLHVHHLAHNGLNQFKQLSFIAYVGSFFKFKPSDLEHLNEDYEKYPPPPHDPC